MEELLSKDLMESLDEIDTDVDSTNDSSFEDLTLGCGCTGDCGQSCYGDCDSGCSGDCGRSCYGGCS